jgi:GMP reductase
MRLISDIKLDYKDVLILPKRSSLASRKEVSLKRHFKFRSGNEWFGVPIIAANDDYYGDVRLAA